jgi:hypothetical protein
MTEITQADRDAAAQYDVVEAFARHRQYGYDQGYYDGRKMDGIEAQAAEIERLREAVDALLQHEASSFFGPDEGKHKRASWRGVIRKAKKARAGKAEQ